MDRNRSAVYAAEAAVIAMVDRGADVAFHGSRLTPEPDRKFGRVADVEPYLDWLRQHEWGFPDAPRPTARQRRGAAKATWEAPGTIAVPDAAWARRELVVLHEYTHHVCWHLAGNTNHDAAFCRTFTSLVREAVGPSTGLLLTDSFYRAGLL